MNLAHSPLTLPRHPERSTPHPVDVYVGERVGLRRRLLGMTQTELAHALGVSFAQINKYESGINRLSASRLSQVADVLRISISYFFDGLTADESTPSVDQTWHEPGKQHETINLIRYYYAITDDATRHYFLLMVKAVAKARISGPTKPAVPSKL